MVVKASPSGFSDNDCYSTPPQHSHYHQCEICPLRVSGICSRLPSDSYSHIWQKFSHRPGIYFTFVGKAVLAADWPVMAVNSYYDDHSPWLHCSHSSGICVIMARVKQYPGLSFCLWSCCHTYCICKYANEHTVVRHSFGTQPSPSHSKISSS